MSLLRGNQEEWEASVLGELLKAKAELGVRVLVMTWNDKSTTAVWALEELSAMMGYDAMKGILKYFDPRAFPQIMIEKLCSTHDEETAEYFADSRV